MDKAKQTSDAVNASIQKAGQAGVEVRKAAPINGHGKPSTPSTSTHTR